MGGMSESDAKDAARRRIEAMSEPRRGQVYEHYKGGLYSVVSVSFMEDTLEVMVTYSSNLKGGDTTRTLADFTRLVSPDMGPGRPRFRRVSQ